MPLVKWAAGLRASRVDILQKETRIPYLSIVIPAYNEAKRIAISLDRIADYLGARTYTYEALVVDDGSTDGTLEICREFASRHEWLKVLHFSVNHGKGHAVRRGVLEAEGEHILICDADLATPIEELDRFRRFLGEGADIVIASRPLRDSHLVERQPLYREFAGRMFNLLVRAVAVRGIHDTQCGFKLIRREAAHSVFPLCSLNGFSFDIEALHVAQRLGFRIKEAPVHWYHKPGSKVKLLRDGMRMFLDLFRIRVRHRNLPRHARDEAG